MGRTAAGRTVIDLAVIPAGGAGRRAWPATIDRPKPLLPVGGRPLIRWSIELVRDQLHITDIVIITGEGAAQVRDALGDGSALGVQLRYVDCGDPTAGLASGILQVEEVVDRPFAVVLSDELYLGSHHERLVAPDGEWLAVCGVLDPLDRRQIAGNYRVELDGDRVVGLEEKPADTSTGVLGLGSWLLTPEIFEWIRATPASARSGNVELVDALRTAMDAGRPIHGVDLGGDYVNVNTVAEHNVANDLARTAAFDAARVTVVIPAFDEEEAIATVVRDLLDSPLVDDVLVVDNSSRDRTAARAAEAGARVETVRCTGYGDTIAWGLDHATSEILVVVEADHSFRAKDLGKLLEYLKDADMVIGTRTTRQLIEQGTNMEGLVRWANVAAGKLLELLWWSQEPRFTDVGCTYRALWRDTWERIGPEVTGTGPEMAPEMMIEVLRAGMRIVEVPVSYHPRLGGASKHSADFRSLAKTGSKMLRLIVARRMRRR